MLRTVTRAGRVLRRTRIDELSQLANLARGDVVLGELLPLPRRRPSAAVIVVIEVAVGGGAEERHSCGSGLSRSDADLERELRRSARSRR